MDFGLNDLAGRYTVFSLPTILFITHDQRILESHRYGYLDPDELLDAMDEVLNIENSLKRTAPDNEK